MLIFDQLKKEDPQLRFLAVLVLAGILILFAGLWWVQVVSVGYYQEKLETQSTRTIRLPAARGKILDREGRPLAENRPSYNIDLYLEELTKNYRTAYAAATARMTNYLGQLKAEKQKELGRKLTPLEARRFTITEQIRTNLQARTLYEVTSNIVADISARLQQPVMLSEKTLQSHYDKARALPLPVLTGLNPMQVARFEEQSFNTTGMDLDVQSVRYYPNGSIAAHLLGYLERNNESITGETADYSNRLPDYLGVAGIEGVFDSQLHGAAGEKLVVINNAGYRQSETIRTPVEPGGNVVLTLDLDIQKAAESALEGVRENVHGAVVVMDVRNGDILAMASAPTYNPNHFIRHPAPEIWEAEWARLTNTELEVQMNHAMQGLYAPGSVFKIVVGMAGLELGVLNPDEIYHNNGYIYVGNRHIKDLAPPGDYNFDTAFAESSNSYFITNGLKPGVLKKVVELGRHLHFGEKTGLIPRQEDRGYFPKTKDISSTDWRNGNTANLSIGQERIAVNPLQVAVMISAVANGGKVFYPRLVSRIEPCGEDQAAQIFPEGRLRDTLGVSQRTLSRLYQAMLADIENPHGTGKDAAVPGLRIAGKTGTAEVEKNGHIDKSAQITWFASFAPASSPRYAVVVMVVSGASGGKTCAPIAHKVYSAIQDKEKKIAAKSGVLAVAK